MFKSIYGLNLHIFKYFEIVAQLLFLKGFNTSGIKIYSQWAKWFNTPNLHTTDVHMNWLNWFHFSVKRGLLSHDLSFTIPRCYKDVYVKNFFPRTARFWNSLPIECFPVTYDLNCLQYRIKRHLLTVGSF